MLRILAVAATLILGLGSHASAQSAAPENSRIAPVPFGIGERATYKVTLGILGGIGTGSLDVVDLDTVQGRPAYELRFRISGGVPFARVEDDYHSWLDAYSLVARRFKQDQKEVRYERKRFFEFFPEEKRWRRLDKDESGTLPTNEPLDDVSFIFFIRTLPLEVGKTYTFNRYFKDTGNPVTIKVLRRETVNLPGLGSFKTIVVQPIIKTKGLFSEGGQAEVYLTDDSRRILVQLKSKVKILKSLDMTLESYSPGERLAPNQ
jgi:hypothetical protein